MLMRTWDHHGFLIEPVLIILQYIFDFFHENDFFGCVINRPDRQIIIKNVRESCVLTVLTRIHNIGHIHNANFVQTQFSTSHPQKPHFLKSRKFTFLWKYLVCGLKFEISEYPIKLLYVTYSPYKYELSKQCELCPKLSCIHTNSWESFFRCYGSG